MDLNLHIGTKFSGRHREPALPESGEEMLVQWNRDLRPGGIDERRTPPFCDISIEGELRDHQDVAVYLAESQVHFPVSVTEEPKACHFLGHPIYLRRGVPIGETNQQAVTPVDRTDRAPGYGY
jgi:hypothetical protein